MNIRRTVCNQDGTIVEVTDLVGTEVFTWDGNNVETGRRPATTEELSLTETPTTSPTQVDVAAREAGRTAISTATTIVALREAVLALVDATVVAP